MRRLLSALAIACVIVCGACWLIGLVAEPVNAAPHIRAEVDMAEPRVSPSLKHIGVIDAPDNVEPPPALAASLCSRWSELSDWQMPKKFLLGGHEQIVVVTGHNASHEHLYGCIVQVGIIHAPDQAELDAVSWRAACVTHAYLRGWLVWKSKHLLWLDGHVCTQLRSRRAPLLNERPYQHDGADDANEQASESKPGSIASRVRSLPLCTKIGIAIVFAALATWVLFDGYLDAGDRGAYRRSGLRKIALGWLLLGLLGAFCWLASPY